MGRRGNKEAHEIEVMFVFLFATKHPKNTLGALFRIFKYSPHPMMSKKRKMCSKSIFWMFGSNKLIHSLFIFLTSAYLAAGPRKKRRR